MAGTVIEKPWRSDPIEGPRYELEEGAYDVGSPAGIKAIWLECPHCNNRSKFYTKYNITVHVGDHTYGFQTDFHYLCQCEFCQDVLYVKCWKVDIDPDWHLQYEAHYPMGSHLGGEGIPPLIYAAAYEASKCLNVSAYLATAVMCRRTIESIVKDQGATGSNLAAAIKTLVDQNSLPASMGDLADLVRIVGNIGAHASHEEVTQEQAQSMFNLTRALVDALYVTPTRVKDMRHRLDSERASQKLARELTREAEKGTG